MQQTPVNNEDVYGLVLSMSAAERALFTKLSGAKPDKAQPLHVQLFSLIASRRVADDAAARQALNLASSAQFSNLKNHLAAALLDAISCLVKEESAEMRHYAGMIELKLLCCRKNYYLARRIFKKLWSEAEECGRYSWLLQLLRYRNTLFAQSTPKVIAAESLETAAAIERYTSYEQVDAVLSMLANGLTRLKAITPLRFLPDQQGEVETIVSKLLPVEISSRATHHLHLRFLSVQADAYYLLQHFNACDKLTDESVLLLQQHPLLIMCNTEQFFNIASVAFYNAFASGNIARAADLLSVFDELAAALVPDERLTARWSIIRFNTALKIAHKTADYKEVKVLMQDRANVIIHAKDVLLQTDALSVMTSICISLFVLEDFAGAEDLLLEIKELNRPLDREDLLYFSLVFHLLILYELKDWYRLDSATEAAYHMLYSRKKLRPFEKELMRFLKHLPVYRGKGTAAPAIRAFLEKLERFRADPVQRLYFLYFNYYDWLQSKLANLSYSEYRRQQLSALPA